MTKDNPLMPVHASEVAISSGSPHECLMVFMEVGVEVGHEYPKIETKVALQPAVIVALPWTTARALVDALSREIAKREEALKQMQDQQERPH